MLANSGGTYRFDMSGNNEIESQWTEFQLAFSEATFDEDQITLVFKRSFQENTVNKRLDPKKYNYYTISKKFNNEESYSYKFRLLDLNASGATVTPCQASYTSNSITESYSGQCYAVAMPSGKDLVKYRRFDRINHFENLVSDDSVRRVDKRDLTGEEENRYSSSATLGFFSNEETAQRVAKAFAHLIKLSQAKKDPF
jgi:hypothetical protein